MNTSREAIPANIIKIKKPKSPNLIPAMPGTGRSCPPRRHSGKGQNPVHLMTF
jgi:hypothetical protein